jgi:hypothetical protein
VNYTISGTATNGTDYNNLRGTVTFAPGSSTAVIDINPINDSEFEDPETVILTLVNSSNYLVGTSNRATVTILDNDVLPTVTIAATDAEAAETNPGQTPNPGRFTLTRTGSTSSALTVNYSIGGTATNGSDFNRLTGTVTFAAGASTAFIDINPINDSEFEDPETVILTLVNSSNYLVGTSNRATVTILDNDVLPTVTIAATDAEAAETNPGQTPNPGRFTLTRTGSTSSALTVNYSIGGTATNGSDFNRLTGTVTFAAGASTAFIDINPINDSEFEDPETVVLTLVNSSNYLVGTSNRATVTIADNDLPTVTIAATDAEAAETNSGQPTNPGRFTLTRTGSTTHALTVNYSIGGTATNGSDFNRLTGTVTFAPGSSTAFIDINPLDDSLVEDPETVVLTLVNSSNYLVGTSNRATVTILDNDVLPTVTIAATDAEAAETNPGQTANPGRFTLTRTGSTSSALTVNYSIGGTATNGMDYKNLSGTVTFAAGSSTAFIDINPINDSEFEDPETVVLTLVNSSNYLVGTSNRATVTILDNDLPTVTIEATDAEAAETNSGQTANPGRFTLTRTGSTSSALTVNYSIGGTATNGMDYKNLSGTVTFAAGSSTAFIDINPINDSEFEDPETVVLTLVNSSNYLVGTSNRATVTILDNDLPTVTIEATDAEAAETNSGQTANPGRFTLTRTGSTTNDLTVNYTISGTATNGTDYNNLSGRVTFAAGSSTAFIDINPINDSEFEDPETVVLTLVNSSNYLVGTSNRATVTILDNDLPTVTIEATDAEAAETNPGQTPNPGRFTLTRTGSTTHALTVNYSIGGTATGGTGNNADYTIGGTSTSVNFINRTGTVTFAAGSSTALIDINPVNDTLVEPSETVILTLLGSSTYQIGTSKTATVTILDNDVPTVIISPNIIQGTLRADTFTYTPTHARTVFIGNGNVDYGAGRRDEIDLSTVSYGTVTFNLANTNGGGVVFDLGNGNHRIFDALTLNDGKEILFEGIERIRFADQTLDLPVVTPNDPHFNQQWNLHMIGVHHAWRFTTGSSNVLIGIQDSGLGVNSQDKVHQEIDIRRTTFLPSNYRDEFGKTISHGTAVQGIIAAESNNGSGIAGINWNSHVFHIDVLDNHDDNDLKLHDAAQKMINEARTLGRKLVINMSLGSDSFGENWHRDLETVVSNDPNVLLVIASGNRGHLGQSGIASPAFLAKDNDNVMAVGAVWGTENWHSEPTIPGTRIEYTRDYPNFNEWGSQYGAGLTLMAPSEVRTTFATRNNATGSVTFDYSLFDGTSAAAPHVTGVASLIWSVNPNLTAAQVKTIMSETAYKGVPDYSKDYYGSGVVNADAAVRRAMAMARGSA